jgi:60 kDa SS-A/Ro ribonucleoprotein
LFDAIDTLNRDVVYDRLIVITDEQAFPANADLLQGREQSKRRSCPAPKGLGYMINVASNQNGVDYGPGCHIDGFSEQALRFIVEHEAAVLPQ